MSLLGDLRKSVREAGEAQRKSAAYLSVGIQIAVAFALFVFGGYKLDEALGTKPIFLLLGMLCALIALFTILLRLAGWSSGSSRTLSDSTSPKSNSSTNPQ
ncbi:MAG: AtpZ/AtpI family protein [Chloroherpetonaceae bacterium]|nr:AtpZ/AtpI family protein [Chloroherpetonaceae bacterium]MCS7211898.1 AtpZ/AtpI family protein [Chloroherpetonaceae bacterium]MDW8019663.1 AtpZ/AtpI family protein [Chloroherpetonaceae bacterium]MDW8465264.1 AtpZ/AtpI family protein [Chloroherpetonaceae bacterium]